jgi:hypothetical protein
MEVETQSYTTKREKKNKKIGIWRQKANTKVSQAIMKAYTPMPLQTEENCKCSSYLSSANVCLVWFSRKAQEPITVATPFKT